MGLIGRGRVARYFGILAVLIPMVVYMYYVYIEAWCLRYAWEYLIGGVAVERPDRRSRCSDVGRSFSAGPPGPTTNGVLNMSAAVLVHRGHASTSSWSIAA